MISCTEFIPAYSELFTYLEDKYGPEEVHRFWAYLFEPTGKGIPLINFAKKDGLRGCWNYWCGTLSEEAADCTRYFNEKAGWIYSQMHKCPSKGRLLELEKEIGITPYHDYCSHCDYYRGHLEAVGLRYIRCHVNVDKASCSNLIYDPKVFKGIMIRDHDTEVLEIRSSEKEYFHPDFHSSLNMGVDYLGKRYGADILRDYLTQYTVHVYAPVIKAMETDPLGTIEAKIRDTYEKEKASDVLEIKRSPDGSQLIVKIAYCPAVKHLRNTGREVSAWFRYTTEVVMETLVKDSGCRFLMEDYDESTGASTYSFEKC